MPFKTPQEQHKENKERANRLGKNASPYDIYGGTGTLPDEWFTEGTRALKAGFTEGEVLASDEKISTMREHFKNFWLK